MRYGSVGALFRAIDGGPAGGGDPFFVSPGVYGALSPPVQRTLWDRVLGVRAALVTGLPMVYGIEVVSARDREAARPADGAAPP